MSDNSTTNTTLIGADSENFMRLMGRALSRIQQVDNATTKANESLQSYAKSFDSLNDKLENYVKLSGNVKTQKFDKVKLNNGSSSGSNRAVSTKVDKSEMMGYQNQVKSVTKSTMDVVFGSINSAGGSYGRIMTSTFKQMEKGYNFEKSIIKGIKGTESAAGAGTKALGGLSTKALAASGVVAGVAIALGAMVAAGKYAYDRNMEVNRSLLAIGDTSNELTQSSSKTANQLTDMKNTWTKVGNNIGNIMEPIFTNVVSFLDRIGYKIEELTSSVDESGETKFTSSDSKARWYTSQLSTISNEPESKSLPVIGGIASSAKQSGFDNTSAANIAIGTYDMAMKKAREYGEAASDVAQKLADAWMKGSDSAKQYGVVVDDYTLIGYMANKGIDIVNTQITDAMKQYYRYQLMQEELNAGSNDAMQNQIKQWKQLGMQIDITKQKLFSFDEVIQLGALDTSIPTLGTPAVSYPNSPGDGGADIPIVTGFPTSPNGSTPNNAPVDVPVNYVPQNIEVLKPAVEPVEIPVNVNNNVALQQLLQELSYLAISTPLHVMVPVAIPGINLPVQLLSYLKQIAQKWSTSVNVSVIGMELLQRAQSLLQQVLSMSGGASKSVSTGASNYSSTRYMNTKGYDSSTIKTAQNMASKNNQNWDNLTDAQRNKYLIVGKEVNSNLMLTQKDGIEMLNNYNATGNASSSKVDWMNGQGTQIANTAGMVGIGLGLLGTGLFGGSALLGAGATAGGAASNVVNFADIVGGGSLGNIIQLLPKVAGFATGGIGLKETTAKLFEGDKKEAVIPLESQAGIDYLANSMKIALGQNGEGSSNGSSVVVNLTLSGVNIADNESQWQKVGEKVAEVIAVQTQRRGELNYGSSF